jgi:hypothetical protein
MKLLFAVVFGLTLSASLIAQQAGEREINTPPAKGERRPTTLKVGDVAPDFTLPDLDGKKEIALSAVRSKKPVVLIFGSHTHLTALPSPGRRLGARLPDLQGQGGVSAGLHPRGAPGFGGVHPQGR